MEDHYRTLGLSHRRLDGTLTAQDFKQAYRKALLEHHPDKTIDADEPARKTASAQALTIDQITNAFKTLSEPLAKKQYDQKLTLSETAGSSQPGKHPIFYTGLDLVDLDDLAYDETSGSWWRGCRCGQERGYIITEDDLDKDAQSGEFITGCRGCSLWLKVLFNVEDDQQRP